MQNLARAGSGVVRTGPLRFVAGCRRQVQTMALVCVSDARAILSLCYWLSLSRPTNAIDCLESLVSEMTKCVD